MEGGESARLPAGGNGPVAHPQLQGCCLLSPDGAQQYRSCLWNYHCPEPGMLGHYSEVVSLLPAQEPGPSQSGECPSTPLPSHSRAAQKMLLAGKHQLGCTPERDLCQDTQTHPEKKACSAHN